MTASLDRHRITTGRPGAATGEAAGQTYTVNVEHTRSGDAGNRTFSFTTQ